MRLADRQVDHAFELAAHAAVSDRVELAIDAAGGDAKLGLVGDDADRAGFARRAVERALRAGEALDAGDVVDVDVERSADRRDRLLVEIGADRRQRAGVVAVAAASRRRACRRSCTPGCGGLEADRRQLLGIILEVRDVQLVEPPRADRLDADRHVLEILLALGRGDDDLGLVGDAARPAPAAPAAAARSRRSRWCPARATGRSSAAACVLRQCRRRKRGRSEKPKRQRAERASSFECPHSAM